MTTQRKELMNFIFEFDTNETEIFLDQEPEVSSITREQTQNVDNL